MMLFWFSSFGCSRNDARLHVHDLAATMRAELHTPLTEGEQGVVLATADACSGVETRSALTNDDLAGVDLLAPEALHAEALRIGVTTVLGRAQTLLCCHSSASALDSGDLHPGVALAMANTTPVTGLVLVTDDTDLRTLGLIQHFGGD